MVERDPSVNAGASGLYDAPGFSLGSGPHEPGRHAYGVSLPPIEIGGSGIGSRAFQCAGLKCYGVAVRMAVLYLLARGKP
jgi:hypothetical protein